jgi:hypothetical protein
MQHGCICGAGNVPVFTINTRGLDVTVFAKRQTIEQVEEGCELAPKSVLMRLADYFGDPMSSLVPVTILTGFLGSIDGALQFDRVIIETTGLADPASVAQTFLSTRKSASITCSTR